MTLASVVCDPAFIVFPDATIDETGLNIADWAKDVVTELINDYWKMQTILEREIIRNAKKELELSFPEFSFSKRPTVLLKQPVLSGIMGTSTFVVHPNIKVDIIKLIKHSQHFHANEKEGSAEYRRAEMVSYHVCYSNKGNINVFGPKTFSGLHTVLSAFLTDLALAAGTFLKQENIAISRLEISNTIITNKQDDVIFDIEKICNKLIKMNLLHQVLNCSIIFKPLPWSCPHCTIKIFESGSISCLGTAPRAIKSLIYHIMDQVIENSKACIKLPSSATIKLEPKVHKNKARHEKHMSILLDKKKEVYEEYEEDLPE